MLCLALTAIRAWSVLVSGAAAAAAAAAPAETALGLPDKLAPTQLVEQYIKKRQETAETTESAVASASEVVYANATATALVDQAQVCQAYGVDFQEGGEYFVDLGDGGEEKVKVGTRFQGCAAGSKAEVLFVDRQTKQQWDCGPVPVTPNGVVQVATCPIKEKELKNGNWSVIIIGDNALKGRPYAYQRDFQLEVGTQTTVTVSKTCVYTYTEKPTVTVTAVSTLPLTSTVANPVTVTSPAATAVITITPEPSTVIGTSIITRTFTTWTRTEKRDTVIVTPTCKIPPQPMLPDGLCKIRATIVPVPQGLNMAPPRPSSANNNTIHARAALATGSTSSVTTPFGAQRTLTITAPVPVNLTTTTTLPARTISSVTTSTTTFLTTSPPKTIWLGTAMQTMYAPAQTLTQERRVWSRTYVVQTMSVGWTWTSTATLGPRETAECRARGGWIEG